MNLILFHTRILCDMLRPKTMILPQYHPYAQQHHRHQNRSYCYQYFHLIRKSGTKVQKKNDICKHMPFFLQIFLINLQKRI